MQVSNIQSSNFGSVSFYINDKYVEIIANKDDKLEVLVNYKHDIILDKTDDVVKHLLQYYGIDEDDKIVIKTVVDKMMDTITENWAKSLVNDTSVDTTSAKDSNKRRYDFGLEQITSEVINSLGNELNDIIKGEVDWDAIKENLIEACRQDIKSIAKELVKGIEQKTAEKLYSLVRDTISSNLETVSVDTVIDEITYDYILGI